MAISFKCRDTQKLFDGVRVKRWVNIETVALRKLAMLHRSGQLNDLRIPPQNKLEALKKDRRGQHSIRINDQWRLCFEWTESGVKQVEIIDHH
jgi:proteic killer suppression protein